MSANPFLPRRFRDREHAGEILADKLGSHMKAPRTVVLGLPRGGVVPAAVVARELGLPLDVLISRKLRAPDNPELAIGALAESGEPFLCDAIVEATQASREYVKLEVDAQRREIAIRRRFFRKGRPLELPDAATAILVDDGIATGSTVMAAVRALREMGAARIIVAAPVAPTETAAKLREVADDVVIAVVADDFGAVSSYYDRFGQVSDETVRDLLEHAHLHAAPHRRGAHAERDHAAR